MSKKNAVKSSNGTEKMAEQIDEIYNRISVLENLISDLTPNIEKMVKEVSGTVNELRERFERDETLQLMKKVGDNIPNFIALLDVMSGVKGMIEDFMPAMEKMSKEIGPTVNEIRERFEKDEMVTLLKQFGDNVPTFIELMNTMTAVKGMIDDFIPATEKISKEIGPTVNEIRERFEKDDILKLLKQFGDNVPTFMELLDVMTAVKGMATDLMPATEKISKEIGPTVNEIRERFEKDDVVKLIKLMGDNIPELISVLETTTAVKGFVQDFVPAAEKISKEVAPTVNLLREMFEREEAVQILQKSGMHIVTLNKLLDFLTRFEASGNLDFTLEIMTSKETDFFMRGLEKSMVVTMQQFIEKPYGAGIKNILTAVNNPEVQKGFVFFFSLIGNMFDHILEIVSEDIMKEIEDK